LIYVIKYGKIYKDIGRTRSSAEILRKIKFNKYRKFSIPIPKPLPHGKGLIIGGYRPSTPLLKDRAFLQCVAGHEVLPKNIF